LMMEGSTLMPAFWMAITKGHLAAVEERFREGSVGETRRPIFGRRWVSYFYGGVKQGAFGKRGSYHEGAG